MPLTFPNQRTVIVHREKAQSDFLGIKNENWQAAARDLRPHALVLYLYLASNRDNYELALSPAAVLEAVGMPRSTYHDQFHVLVSKGYLVPKHGNTYEFYEVPRPRDEIQRSSQESKVLAVGQANENGTSAGIGVEQAVHNVEQRDIQINNNMISHKQGTINNIDSANPKEEVSLIPPIKEIVLKKKPTAKGKIDFEEFQKPKKQEFIF